MGMDSDRTITQSADKYIKDFKKRCAFERIPIDRPVKLYLDVDIKRSIEDAEELMMEEPRFLPDILKVLKSYFKDKFDMSQIAILTSHSSNTTNDKGEPIACLSYNFIMNNITMMKAQQLYLVKELNTLAYELLDKEDFTDTYKGPLFDTSVYNDERKIRALYAYKHYAPDRPKILYKGTEEQTIISAFIPEDAITIVMDIPTKSASRPGRESRRDNLDENDYIEKYNDYMSLIPSSHWEDYNTWFKIQRASANLLIPFEVYDEFMKPCKGYDQDNNREKYEQPHNDKKGRIGWGFIYETANSFEPMKKAELDEKYGIALFCKYKFASIKGIETLEIKQLKKDLESAKIKEKKTLIKDLTKQIHDLETEEDYKLQKIYFEKFHFKCMSPLCYVRKTEDGFDMLSDEKVSKTYRNLGGFIHMWLNDMNIREYETCDFNPPPITEKRSQFNLYTGLAYKSIVCKKLLKEECTKNSSIFIKHLWYLCGKNNQVLEYVLNYLAHIIQEPGELPRTSLIFKSLQGCGKNVFFESFGNKILGEKYVLSTANLDDILGRFPRINQKFLVLMDEANGKDSFMANDKIKSFITAPKVGFERKGIDSIDIKNCGRMIFFTNNDYPVKIEQNDRRFVVAECSNDIRNNTEYFKALLKAFNNNTMVKSFALFLKNRDISNFDPTNDRPITEIYKSIQTATIPMEQRFFKEYTGFDYGNIVQGKDIFSMFSNWSRLNGKSPMNEQTFISRMKNYEFITTKRDDNKRCYIIDEILHSQFIESGDNEIEEDKQDDFPVEYC